MFPLISPKSRKNLVRYPNRYCTADGLESYVMEGNVIRFLKVDDDFYEGSYLNRITYNPSSNSVLTKLTLWVLNCGYIWTVGHVFPSDSILLELGCAGGVDYFGSRFKMIGLDLSFKSLTQLNGYQLGIQASATEIPLADNSVDGIISSFFWEHIDLETKEKMLNEFKRVLKTSGKMVFLYDVESQNTLVNGMRSTDPIKYQKLFKDNDGHIGYATPTDSQLQFTQAGFKVIKHFGMERTWVQSSSVYEKMRHFNGVWGWLGKFFFFIFSWRLTIWANMILVRIVDETIGRMWPLRKSRIIMTVVQKIE